LCVPSQIGCRRGTSHSGRGDRGTVRLDLVAELVAQAGTAATRQDPPDRSVMVAPSKRVGSATSDICRDYPRNEPGKLREF